MDANEYIYPLDWHEFDDEKDNKHYIEIYGLNRQSESMLVRSTYEPYFYIGLPLKAPGNVAWNKESIREFILYLMQKRRGNWKSYLDDSEFSECTSYSCRTFHGYLDGKKKHLKVRFYTRAAMNNAKRRLESASLYFRNTKIKVDISESDIESVRQFTVERNIINSYCNWIAFSDPKETTIEKKKVSRFKREYHTIWTKVGPPPPESNKWRVYPRIAGYDIECKAAKKNAFPDAKKFNDISFMISLVYMEESKPETKRKICVVFGDGYSPEGIEVHYTKSEEEMIDKFCSLLNELDIDIMAGHYNLGFDDSYLNQRYMNLWRNWPEIGSRIKGRLPTFHDHSWQSNNTNQVSVKYIDFPGRIFFDTKIITKANILRPLPNYTLNMVSESYLGKKKLDVDHTEIYDTIVEFQTVLKRLNKCTKEYKKNYDNSRLPHDNVSKEVWSKLNEDYKISLSKMGKLIEYCIKDSELVVELLQVLNVFVNVSQNANIIQVRAKQIYTKGQQYKSISQLYSLLKQKTDKDPDGVVFNMSTAEVSDKKYEGALNWGTIYQCFGITLDVGSVDVKSMYPSILAENNICISTEFNENQKDQWKNNYKNHEWTEDKTGDHYNLNFVTPDIHVGFFPQLVKKLMKERGLAKKTMEKYAEGTFEYVVWNAVQNALKVSANSMYGILGTSKNPRIPAKHLAALVTKIGRDMARSMAKFIEHGGDPTKKPILPRGRIIYGDTDSLQFVIEDPNLNVVERIAVFKLYAKKINEYIYPIEVDPEKFGDLWIVTAKKYIYHYRDKNETLSYPPYDKNPNFGNYIGKNAYKYTGVEYVKRNQPAILKRLYAGIINANLSENLELLGIDPKAPLSEIQEGRLQKTIDLIFQQSYLVLRNKNPIEDYQIYEAYNGENGKLGPLGVNMAELGKPIQVGERVAYIVVKDTRPKTKEKKKKADNYRLLDAIQPGERLDTDNYIKGLMTPIDNLVRSHYCNTGSEIFKRWFTKKNAERRTIKLLKKKGLIDGAGLANINIRMMNIIKENLIGAEVVLPKQISSINTYSDLIAYKGKDDYMTEIDKSIKSKLTNQIKAVSKTGLPLTLPDPSIINHIILANSLGILDDYAKIMMSEKAFGELK